MEKSLCDGIEKKVQYCGENNYPKQKIETMKKMMYLCCIAALGITLITACNSTTEKKEGDNPSSKSKTVDKATTYNESSTYNKVIDSNYALACIKAYDSIYDVKNIRKNEKAIAKAFSKSITFPRHDDSTDIASWIANLAKNPATKDYEGIRIRLGIYVDPKTFNLDKDVKDNITAFKFGRLTAFLWAYKLKNSSNMRVAGDSTFQVDLGEPLNYGDLKP
jgi:hypothetical protein